MLHHMRTASPAIALLVLLAFGLQACSDTYVQGTIVGADAKQDTGGFIGMDLGLGDNAEPDDTTSWEDATTGDIELKREIIVLLNLDFPQVLGPSAFLPIYAKVVDYGAGSPADGVPVFWEIVENQGINGPGLGALDSAMTATDEKGLTGNVFHANKSPAVAYKLKLSCEGAEDVYIDVTVTDLPKGTIRVTMVYDNEVPLGQVMVRLMPSPFSCASFKPVYPPAGFVGSKTTLLEDKPEFLNLAADKKYGIYVIGKDQNNHLTAAGCADGVLVMDKQVTEVTVTVYTLPLMASGPYDMINHFDFTGAIPGQLGKILDTAVQIFYDPGAFIISQVKNLVKQMLPGIIVDLAFGLFEDALAGVVTDWLLNKSPPWLQSFFTMGQDVLQIVKNLEMLGDLIIKKVSNEYFVKGDINFTGVNLYWKLGCDKKDPNYATCGQIPLDLKQAVVDPNFPLDLVGATFTGTISAQTKLTIDSGTVKLNYGKLILFVLTQVVLKKITGETTFLGAMEKLINCDGIAKGIGGSILGKIGLSEATVKGICSSTVSLLVMPLEAYLGGLALDSKLSLNGGCTMVDDTDDLKVDKLIDGYWVGTIVTDTPGKPFKGDFTATRKPGF
ncbi:MAG: hypothetical protein ACOYOB_04155 [Myxococcota bacterium]